MKNKTLGEKINALIERYQAGRLTSGGLYRRISAVRFMHNKAMGKTVRLR